MRPKGILPTVMAMAILNFTSLREPELVSSKCRRSIHSDFRGVVRRALVLLARKELRTPSCSLLFGGGGLELD